MAGARAWNSIVGAGEVARVLPFKRPRVLLLKALSIRVRGGSLTIGSATTRRGRGGPELAPNSRPPYFVINATFSISLAPSSSRHFFFKFWSFSRIDRDEEEEFEEGFQDEFVYIDESNIFLFFCFNIDIG